MKIWFLSEVYFPDEQGTAFYTTGIAEGLARTHDVNVLCSSPTVTARGTQVASKEVRNGVTIERRNGMTLNKDVLLQRLINILTYTIAIFFKALIRVKKGDVVIAVTSPPSAPYIAKCVAWCKGATCILRLEDVYPEILVATGLIKPKGFIDTCFGQLNKLLFKSADRIVVLGRDMKALAEKRIGSVGKHIRIIRSWADTDVVVPGVKSDNPLLTELGLTHKFVVSCVGNMGRAQAIEFIFEAITLLKDNDMIHFLFIGSGSKRTWMESEINKRGLRNVTIVGQRPRTEQSIFLNACDVSMISLLPGVTGAGVPSRTYNLMAAGKPIIAVTREDSEVSLLVKEEMLGWIVPGSDADNLAQVILEAYSDSDKLGLMGTRAYAAAKAKFSRENIIDEYRNLIAEMHVYCPIERRSFFGRVFDGYQSVIRNW